MQEYKGKRRNIEKIIIKSRQNEKRKRLVKETNDGKKRFVDDKLVQK